ncbi:exonuclease domain-containing protein [Parafilimonas sp.]|uniref:exonuclease domain-containing protein n=1 Tax=Parafilimonas sp. TaxID=1969739 RepID=UPI0039E3C22C
MYAIVDIETTGSHPDSNGITEIAIVLHNGAEVEGRYETLVNPGCKIPSFITHLTGISNEAVASAPCFSEVAQHIHNLLSNRIFIAHNVNFDYTFIRYHLQVNGYHWLPKKLCTLKLSRKAFPGLAKYGLGHICRALEIPVVNRHRAGGDADATAILFQKILREGGEKLIKDFLKKDNHEQILPPNLPKESIQKLPYIPGVYYFHNAGGKIIYVGKAKNLKKRVLSHFTGLNTGKKRQEFLRNIYEVTFTECPTEFTAFILESIEIKKYWPEYNFSQKRAEQFYGIYLFEDSAGFLRLAIDKKRKHTEPIASFALLSDAHRTLWKAVKQFELHPALCFLQKQLYIQADIACAAYNIKVKQAVAFLQENIGTFAIIEAPATGNKKSCILVENGKFYGMGLLPPNNELFDPAHLKNYLTAYPENEMIRTLVKSYIQKNTGQLVKVN